MVKDVAGNQVNKVVVSAASRLAAKGARVKLLAHEPTLEAQKKLEKLRSERSDLVQSVNATQIQISVVPKTGNNNLNRRAVLVKKLGAIQARLSAVNAEIHQAHQETHDTTAVIRSDGTVSLVVSQSLAQITHELSALRKDVHLIMNAMKIARRDGDGGTDGT